MCKWEAFPNTPFILTDNDLPPCLFIWRHTLLFFFCISYVLSIWITTIVFSHCIPLEVLCQYIWSLPLFIASLPVITSGLISETDFQGWLHFYQQCQHWLQFLQVFSLEKFIPHPAPPVLLLLCLDWQPWLFSVSVNPYFFLMSSLFPYTI